MNERDLFLSAIEIEDLASRQAYVQSKCSGDVDLLSRVESLLASHASQSQFLQIPVAEQLSENATVNAGSGSTQNDETSGSVGSEPSQGKKIPSDEIPLGFLEPSSRPDSLGRLGHYEILEIVGRGAFGTVLRAFDEKLQRVVAIKVMAVELAATSPARKRFLREAQSSAQIRHEHVVSVYAVEEKPVPYLVMEYIPGMTLQERLDEKGPLDVATVLRLGIQIAEGLAAAHALNLIHRDIKPGNILLETGVNDRVKITDFGLARAADDASMTQSGTIAGTPMYMAPEQALGHKLDQRADLFSFGTVLYQMVSGRPPFRASSTLAVLRRLTEDTPRPIQEIIPETPQWLCDIIAKLHAKAPEDRYQSAREVADVLSDCQAQLEQSSRLRDFSRIPRRDPQPSARIWKWAAAAAFLLPFVVIAATELGGVTQLFRGRQGAPKIGNSSGKPPIQTTSQGTAELSQWVQLFNGKDLTGWKTHPDAPGDWRVEDGAIVGRGGLSFLLSESPDYSNFHLRVEAKINPTGDSGILFRRSSFRMPDPNKPGEGDEPDGWEAQIGVRPNFLVHTGSLWAGPTEFERAPLLLHAPNEWFVLEVIADGSKIQTRVNGKPAVEYHDKKQSTTRGHIALQTWGKNITAVQFRKIEIKELPPGNPSTAADLQSPPHYVTDEWIDVLPLIDPQRDRWNNSSTGLNEWRLDGGELVSGYADDKLCKLLLPLDASWQAFECEVEFTRRVGTRGFMLTIPTAVGECPVGINPLNYPGISLGRRGGGAVLNQEVKLQSGNRTTMRLEVRSKNNQDHVTVWVNDMEEGAWEGDLAKIAGTTNEGYPHARRMSLWIFPGRNEFVFHRIRVRMLDGGTADSLRPISNSPRPVIAPLACF